MANSMANAENLDPRYDKFSSEELERLKKLPIISVNISGKAIKAIYDEANLTLYHLDENAVLNGKKTVLITPLDLNKSKEKREQEKAIATEQAEKSKEGEKPHCAQKMPPQKLMFLIIVGLAVIAIIATVILLTFPKKSTPKTPLEIAGEAVNMAESEYYDIIRTTRDIIPGEQISAGDIEKVRISTDLFNQYALSDDFAYKWDKAKDIEGLYANQYIPQGGYLTYNNIVGAYFSESNPWEVAKDGYGFIDIPIVSDFETQKIWLIGASVDLVVQKKTYSDKPTSVETPRKVEGLDHSSTITEKIILDTYSFKNIQIANLFSADGATNFYSKYSSLVKIPDGEQRSYFEGLFAANKENGNAFLPAFIRIQLPLEQIAVIGSLTAENTVVDIEVVPSVTPYDDAQTQFFTKERLLTNSIANAAYEKLGIPKPAAKG